MQFLPERRLKPSIDLSPLVDVVFLLIIFFTVSTTFRDGVGLPVSLPSAESAATTPSGPVEVNVSDDGRVEVAGQVFSSAAEARGALESALADASPKTVMIRGDRQAAYETIIEVIDLARTLGAEGMSLSTSRRVPAADERGGP